MYTKLILVLAAAAVVPGFEYPPGVDPISCPDYPYCTGGPVAIIIPEGQPIPEWVYNPSILPVAPQDPAHHAATTPQPAITPAPLPAAPRYPAEFNPALCPNYPYCW